MELAHDTKLQIFKSSQNDITFLRFAGIIDEGFDGAGIAKGLSGQLIISMAEIRRITSFGIRQWMECISRASESCTAIYFVECAPRIIDQFNMVANFGGKGSIVSFYAPFRCDSCGAERLQLVQVDKDREMLRELRIDGGTCPNDGTAEMLDDDPQAFLSCIASQPAFEMDQRVAAFLAGRTQYSVPDALRKVKIEKKIRDRYTFISISGDIAEDLPTQKIAEGLEGDVVLDLTGVGRATDAGIRQWRLLLQAIAPSTERILVVGLPASMLEHLTRAEDLAEKGQVLSLFLPYGCRACTITSQLEVNVIEHYDVLKFATAPDLTCPDCKTAVTCAANDVMLSKLPELPAPASDLDIPQLIKWAREPVGGPAPVKALPAPAQTVAAPTRGYSIFAAVALLGLVGAAAAIYLVTKRDPSPERGGKAVLVEASHPAPPRWRDRGFAIEGEQMLIVGSGGFVADKEEGFKLSHVAALDELCHQVGASIRDPLWVEHVGAQYQSYRAKALGDLEKALIAGDAEAIVRARQRVVARQEKVARSLMDAVGSLVQPEQAQFYWEKLRSSQGIRYQVWSLFRIPKNELRRLVEHYSKHEEALSTVAVPYFPAMAWRYDLTQGGVVIGMKPDSPLRFLGVLAGDILVSAQDRVIKDGRSFARVLTEEQADLQRAGGTMVLRIQRGDAPVAEHRMRVAKRDGAVAQPKGKKVAPEQKGKKLPPNVNIWDDDPFQ